MNCLNQPTYIRALLKEHNLRLKKNWGQNFMISPHALDLLLKGACIRKEDVVVEIGPGLGALTQRLLPLCEGVIAIEQDVGLAKLLPLHLPVGTEKKLVLIQDDFLKVNLKETFTRALKKVGKGGNVRVVSNLPYSITTPALTSILESRLGFESITITVQKEVAERVVAKPGGKEIGALSLLVQYHGHPKIIGKIKPAAFYPPPEIDSVVLSIELYANPPVEVKDETLFFKVVRISFSQRRKMLRNNLKPLASVEKLKEAFLKSGVSPDRRPETLSLKEFAALTKALM